MYQRILVAIDGSLASGGALREAICLARTADARLFILHVVDDVSYARSLDLYTGFVGEWEGVLHAEGVALLEEAGAWAAKAGVDSQLLLHEGFGGATHEVVLREARLHRVGLIVMGTHGRRGRGHLQMGHDAGLVLSNSGKPVLLVQDPVQGSAWANEPLVSGAAATMLPNLPIWRHTATYRLAGPGKNAEEAALEGLGCLPEAAVRLASGPRPTAP